MTLSRHTLPATVATAVAICVAVSCNTAGCYDNQSSIPLAGFYADSSHNEITVDSISIGGVGAPDDSLLLNNATASKVYLPFRADRNSTSFYIHYDQQLISDPALNDTLTFTYSSEPYFASDECGAMYRYTIISCDYTTHLVASVEVTDPLITNADIERIHIYFRTSDTTAK
ncbi:MAG: DUF6452 family protein [Pseudoflavonifractor sp.]|nr:DUF6452 family protein [Pseudoflavonifractor sp.]